VVVHTLFSLIGKIFGNIEIRMLSWFDDFSINLKGKGSKIPEVDSSTSKNVLFDVFSKSSDDKVELGFRI